MSWFGSGRDDLDVAATYDLAHNASRFAKEGVGLAVALDGIVDTGPGTGLVFRPLSPTLETSLFVVWRKHQRLPPSRPGPRPRPAKGRNARGMSRGRGPTDPARRHGPV